MVMELRKRKPTVQQKQILNKRRSMNSEDMVEEKVATAEEMNSSEIKMIGADYEKSSNEENPFDRVPQEIMVKMFKLLCPSQVFKNRIVCRRFYDASKDKIFNRSSIRFVMISGRTIYIRAADLNGNFLKGIDQVHPLSELWRLKERPIEKLKINNTPLEAPFCGELYQLVKDHNIKVIDLYVNSRCAAHPEKTKFDPPTFYKIIEALEPKSLVLNINTEFQDVTRQIAENSEMTKKMDFLLIRTTLRWLPKPVFYIQLPEVTIDAFFDYFSCVNGNHVGPYERIPSIQGPMFKRVPSE